MAFDLARPETVETLPALAFVFPYHEMLLRGLLNVDGLGVKTRRSNWNYRGPVLLYTSHGHYHRVPAEAYHLYPDKFPRGVIVGVGTLIDSRPLTREERIKITSNFNRVDPETAGEILFDQHDNYITPLPFGVFFKDIERFKTPVPFKPRPGSITIMRVPIELVAEELKKVGIDPKKL